MVYAGAFTVRHNAPINWGKESGGKLLYAKMTSKRFRQAKTTGSGLLLQLISHMYLKILKSATEV